MFFIQSKPVQFVRIGGIRGCELEPDRYCQILKSSKIQFHAIKSLGNGLVVIASNAKDLVPDDVRDKLHKFINKPTCFPTAIPFDASDWDSINDTWVRKKKWRQKRVFFLKIKKRM